MRAFIALVLVAVILLGGVAAYQQQIVSSAEATAVGNEGFQSPTAGEVIQLDQSNLTGAYYSDNETVRNDSDVEMEEGVDYEWLNNGTIRPLSGGDLAGDANGTIDYHYRQTSPEQRARAEFVSLVLGNAGWIVIVGVLILLLSVLGGMM